jgi:hypothetical protein
MPPPLCGRVVSSIVAPHHRGAGLTTGLAPLLHSGEVLGKVTPLCSGGAAVLLKEDVSTVLVPLCLHHDVSAVVVVLP